MTERFIRKLEAKPVTPKQIIDVVREPVVFNENTVDRYPPTEEDIEEKGDE